MTTLEILEKRNQEFARHQFNANLSPMGTLKTMIVGCVDARVDPAYVLGLDAGDAMVIRTLGGRITPTTLQTISLLLTAAQMFGASPSTFNIVVLHHTQCGITSLVAKPDLLADYFSIDKAELEAKAVTDPRAAVAVDVAMIKANPITSKWTISGLVYDVKTGLVETVVAPDSL